MAATTAFAGITVTQNLGANVNSWPGTPLLGTTSIVNTQSSVAEGFNAPATSYGQTFTIPADNNYTLLTIYLYAGGGTGTSDSAPVTISLYDLGAPTAPNPDPYTTPTNLLGNGNGVTIPYVTQSAGLLKLGFTGTDQVTLGAGHMYAFEISGTSGTNPMGWYRTTTDTYLGAAGYRNRSWINSSNARDFSMAVYGTITTNQPGPTSCTVNAAPTYQQIDGFGSGVVFLNNGVTNLTEAQMDQLYGTSGTQSGARLCPRNTTSHSPISILRTSGSP